MNTLTRRRRVIISATCFADADAAIAIATRLAQKIEGDVLGLLVEDETILRYAQLPFAKAMVFHSGTRQPVISQVTTRSMNEAFQRDARFFQSILAKAANEASLDWTFESKRGSLISLLHSVATKGDFILLGYQQTRPARGEIICIGFADKKDELLLELGQRLARDMNVPLHTIALKALQNENVTETANMQAPEQSKGEHPSSPVSGIGRGDLLEYLRKASPTAVLISTDIEQDTDLAAIRDAARCPVVLSVQN